MTHHALLTPIRGMLGLALLLAGMSPVHGAEAALTDIFAGKTVPLTVRLKDLNGDWCRMVVTDQSSNSDLLMMMEMEHMDADELMLQPHIYYTTGQILAIGGEQFLVAYSQSVAEDGFLELMQGGERKLPAPLTADTALTLTLLSTRAINAMRDIQPFSLEQELNRGKQQQQVMEGAQLKAQQTQSANNLRQIAIDILVWAADHDNKMPPLDIPDAFKQMQVNDAVTRHPVTNEFYRLNASLAGKAMDDPAFADATLIVMVYEATPWPSGRRYAAFMDGHVNALNAEQWAKAMKVSGIKEVVAQEDKR